MAILIFTPTCDDGPDSRTVESVSQQTYRDYDYEVSWLTDPLLGRNFQNVVRQYQKAWEMTLAGGYEALLTVEHDMILPLDAVEKLMATDAGVVYGLYLLRHGLPTLNAWRHEGNRNMGMSLSLYPAEVKAARARGWAEVSGVGWGCTLIWRDVVQRFGVHGSKHDAGDMAFAIDTLRGGVKKICRFDVECGHIEPNGNVLWPFQNGGIVSRVLAKANVNVNVAGQTKELKQGSYYSLPPDTANELSRAGYVFITNDDEGVEETDITAREKAVEPKAAKRERRGK